MLLKARLPVQPLYQIAIQAGFEPARLATPVPQTITYSTSTRTFFAIVKLLNYYECKGATCCAPTERYFFSYYYLLTNEISDAGKRVIWASLSCSTVTDYRLESKN